VFILPGTEGITAPPTASSRLLADVGVCVCVRGRGLRSCVSDKATPTRPCLNEITVKAVKANGKIKRESCGEGGLQIHFWGTMERNLSHKMELETQ